MSDSENDYEIQNSKNESPYSINKKKYKKYKNSDSDSPDKSSDRDSLKKSSDRDSPDRRYRRDSPDRRYRREDSPDKSSDRDSPDRRYRRESSPKKDNITKEIKDEHEKKEESQEEESYEVKNYDSAVFKRLNDFLKKNNYTILDVYSENGICCFIKIYNSDNNNFIILTIPKKYNIDCDNNSIKLKYVEKIDMLKNEDDNFEYNKINKEEYLDEDKHLNEEEINNLLSKEYKNIDIETDKTNKLNEELLNIKSQLKRLKSCMIDLKYKICIETNTTFCILNNKNNIKCYTQNNKKKGNNYKKIFITIDMENFYNNINNINIDLLKIQEELYKVINSTHSTQISIIKTHIKKFNNIKDILNNYEIYRNRLSDKITSISKKVRDLDKREKELKIKISDNVRKTDTASQFIQKDNKDKLVKIINTKSEAMEILIELKENYDNFILNFENVLIKNIKLLKKVGDNFDSVFL